MWKIPFIARNIRLITNFLVFVLAFLCWLFWVYTWDVALTNLQFWNLFSFDFTLWRWENIKHIFSNDFDVMVSTSTWWKLILIIIVFAVYRLIKFVLTIPEEVYRMIIQIFGDIVVNFAIFYFLILIFGKAYLSLNTPTNVNSFKNETQKLLYQLVEGNLNSANSTVLIAVILFVFLIIIFSYVFLTSRFAQLKVFISYKHTYSDIANQIKHKLNESGISVLMLPFGKRDHDVVLLEVQSMLRECDMVIVIPDLENPSFVDAEIFAASLLKKPIAIIKHNSMQTLPNTAFKGYPVFNFSQLFKYNFKPLIKYCLFAVRHIKDYWNMISRIKHNIINMDKGTDEKQKENSLKWITILVVVALLGVLLSSIMIGYTKTNYIYQVVCGIVLFVGILIHTLQRIGRILDVSKQKVVTGEKTHFEFDKLLGLRRTDADIMACLEIETLERKKDT